MDGQARAWRLTSTAASGRQTSRHDAESLVVSAVRRAQAGDRDAFAFLYVRFADDVCGYARSIVRDCHEAEDITQQVFVKLTHAIEKYREREVPFFAWLLRVTRNVAVDHLRRQHPLPVEEVRGERDELGGDLPNDRLADLSGALAALPPAQREVLVLRHLAGMSPPEIAETMGKTESSVHGLHNRGRRALIASLIERGAAPATARRAR